MAYSTRFGKPNMTNLPSELGTAIFKQILSTPRPDYAKMQEEAIKLEKEMVKVREREDAQRTAAK
ncbi:MAG: hypothetical protein IJK56_09300 [Firmicutes bacterium]|nr:hypothetical protein [Bacillota bacterium]